MLYRSLSLVINYCIGVKFSDGKYKFHSLLLNIRDNLNIALDLAPFANEQILSYLELSWARLKLNIKYIRLSAHETYLNYSDITIYRINYE